MDGTEDKNSGGTAPDDLFESGRHEGYIGRLKHFSLINSLLKTFNRSSVSSPSGIIAREQLTPEQETYYQYTCLPGDYIKMCTVPTPRLDATDLAREKKMLEL